MSSKNHIVQSELPLSQDFSLLKEEGLALIKKSTGYSWTNFNDSDSGVTILDQVVYALTELGYCDHFSIKDLLTDRSGQIQFQDQFFKPDDIFTTAPVLESDYVFYLVDQVPAIKNADLIPKMAHGFPAIRYYDSYLLRADLNKNNDLLEFAAHGQLQKVRNIGEVFSQPKVLKPLKYTLTATLELEKECSPSEVIDKILVAVRQFTFPYLEQKGYKQLIAEGVGTGELFDGPKLTNGWIYPENSTCRKQQIKALDIIRIVGAIEGVKSISGLSFLSVLGTDDLGAITAGQIDAFEQAIPVLELTTDQVIKNLKIIQNEKEIAYRKQSGKLYQSNLQDLNALDHISASLELIPEEPIGRFQDVSDYFSIQETFPAIFKVGLNSPGEKAEPYAIAQSNQLKGYLMAFDQVIANQFAQLANISKLYSFRNSPYGDPISRDKYDRNTKLFYRGFSSFPVPYKQFCPTYFYQPLYGIPHIKSVMSDYDMHYSFFQEHSQKKKEHLAWKRYKEDPYNPYAHHMMEIMEEDTEADLRRNRMLNHLLARHGELDEDYGIYLDDTDYDGSLIRTGIVTKSNLLINLDKLTYNRFKGYNYIGGNSIKDLSKSIDKVLLAALFNDGVYDSRKIENDLDVTLSDTVNYSGFELRLNMMLGLESHLRDVLVIGESMLPQSSIEKFPDTELTLKNNELMLSTGDVMLLSQLTESTDKESKTVVLKRMLLQLQWLITERKGSVLIEPQLLLKSASFIIIVFQSEEANELPKASENLSFTEFSEVNLDDLQRQLLKPEEKPSIKMSSARAAMIHAETEGVDFSDDENMPNGIVVIAQWKTADKSTVTVNLNQALFKVNTLGVLPSYVSKWNATSYRQKLDRYASENLPLGVINHWIYASCDQLTSFIPFYVKWHNAMLYSSEKKKEKAHVAAEISAAGELVKVLVQLTKNA